MSKHLKTNYKQLGLYIALICSPLSFANAYEGLKENILCFDIEQNIIHVHGVVKDALGEGIIGASILEQGTTNGTITDIEGRF